MVSSVVIIYLCVWGIISWMIGEKADSRDESQILWTIVTFVFGIFGVLLFYLLVLNEDSKVDDYIGCTNCGSLNEQSKKYCGECGSSLQIKKTRSKSSSTGVTTEVKAKVKNIHTESEYMYTHDVETANEQKAIEAFRKHLDNIDTVIVSEPEVRIKSK